MATALTLVPCLFCPFPSLFAAADTTKPPVTTTDIYSTTTRAWPTYTSADVCNCCRLGGLVNMNRQRLCRADMQTPARGTCTGAQGPGTKFGMVCTASAKATTAATPGATSALADTKFPTVRMEKTTLCCAVTPASGNVLCPDGFRSAGTVDRCNICYTGNRMTFNARTPRTPCPTRDDGSFTTKGPSGGGQSDGDSAVTAEIARMQGSSEAMDACGMQINALNRVDLKKSSACPADTRRAGTGIEAACPKSACNTAACHTVLAQALTSRNIQKLYPDSCPVMLQASTVANEVMTCLKAVYGAKWDFSTEAISALAGLDRTMLTLDSMKISGLKLARMCKLPKGTLPLPPDIPPLYHGLHGGVSS